MKAKISLYEIQTIRLQKETKRGRKIRFAYIVSIDDVNVKICPSEKSASNFLYKFGFRLNENAEFVRTHKSDLDLFIEKHYKIIQF
jgi:hypothetical protein